MKSYSDELPNLTKDYFDRNSADSQKAAAESELTNKTLKKIMFVSTTLLLISIVNLGVSVYTLLS